MSKGATIPSCHPAARQRRLDDEGIRLMLPPSTGMIELADGIIAGLRLRVSSTGLRTFILRRRLQGKMRTLMLGRFDPAAFGIEAARRAAVQIVETETAPGPQSAKPPHHRTMRNLLDAYLASKAHLRSVHEVERIFRRDILPHFGERPPETLTRSEITLYLDKFRARSTALAAAAQLHAFFSWYLPRCDALTGNPCSDAGRPPRLKARDRILKPDELAALWRIARKEGSPFGTGVQLLMLTLQRRSEVFGAHLSEFDLNECHWLIPGARTKNGRSHLVPLSSAVVTILQRETSSQPGSLLFPARGDQSRHASGYSKAWKRICLGVEQQLGRTVERFTMHDLRRTGATMLQSLGVRLEVTEAILNHVTGSRGGIVGVYQRYDYLPEKTAALNGWSHHLESIIQRARGVT